MPDLLLELFSEEIPARMQAQACEDLKRLAAAALAERDLAFEGIAAFATPRRLSLHVAGLPNRQPDRREEKKGPRVGAPEAAIQGFLKSAGLASLAEAQIERDPKKGEFYVAIVERAGGATLDVLAEVLPSLIRSFPWPKSMRWGAGSARPDALRWVRPLHSILATFGPETEEPEIVPFAVGPIASGNMTQGHRFLAPGAIKVRRFDDYVTSLDKAKVVLDAARRRDIILYDARTLAMAQGLDLVEDDALLHEVAGLVEWPVVLMGTFDAAFLDIPPEVIRATIRANQKCFVLRETARERLGNKFILVSNIAASDGGTAIAAGNARVVRARLSDAKFFWDTDRKIRLEARLPKLETIVFHEKLGTQGARVRRLVALAQTIAPRVGADPKLAARAAELAKPDLVSEMVGEFPELQGLMGRYYAQAQGEDAAVAAAIEEHYKPQGPGDRVPNAPVSIAVALADKLDVLTGFWAIDEKPTGSKDPFALRRAALGVLRLVLDNDLRLPLSQLIEQAFAGHATANAAMAAFVADGAFTAQGRVLCDQLLAFFADRLKVHLREQGARYDLIDAVFALAGQDDILLIVRRVEALGRFLATDEGKNLFAGTRRAANILRAEEKKDGAGAFAAPCDPALFGPDEVALWQQLTRVETEARQHLARAAEADDDSSGRPFEDAMECLSSLRTRVDAFFEAVTVNADDPALRLNRLRLMNSLRAAVHQVADFSKIAG